MRDVRAKGFAEQVRIEEAWERFEREASLKPLPSEEVTFPESLGRILAEDIQAESDAPPFDRAAMDGYAVRAEDTYGASSTSPIILDILGVTEIGVATPLRLGKNQAIQSSTGTPMPEEADSVVMYEYTSTLGGGRLAVQRAVAPSDNVSKRGEDVKRGEIVLRKGTLVEPYDIGMMAVVGATKVQVTRRPRVAIFTTGDELVEPSGKPEHGRTVDVNRYILQALVKMMGGEPLDYGIVKDDRRQITAALTQALEEADLVLCTGGTSVGSRDLVPMVVDALGEPGIIVHGVSMKPGKPVALASVQGKPIVMLPGYPVATIMAFLVFVRRILARMLGASVLGFGAGIVRAKIACSIPSTPGVRDYVRVSLEKTADGYVATPIRAGGSGIVSSMVRANGIVVIPEDVEGLTEGEDVDVILLRPLGEGL